MDTFETSHVNQAPMLEPERDKRPSGPVHAPALVRELLLDLMRLRTLWDFEFDPYLLVRDALGDPTDEPPEQIDGMLADALLDEAVRYDLDGQKVFDLIAAVATPEQAERIGAAILARAERHPPDAAG
jgi:hypothetical protein